MAAVHLHLPAGAVAVRNSRDPRGPALVYTRAELTAFLLGAKNGEFDDLMVWIPAGQLYGRMIAAGVLP